MRRLECSVWTNGGRGEVLGGTKVRQANFDRQRRTVTLVLDGVEVGANIAKPSFWTATCGELIQKEIGVWVRLWGLRPGERVWLLVVEPGVKFELLGS